MSKTSKFAVAFGFAAAARAIEGEDKDKKDAKAKPARMEGESDDDYAKRCEEEEKKKEAKAEGGKEGEGDEKKKDEETKAAARREGVMAERERWTAVLSNPVAADRGVTACTLLETTDMDAKAICATLASVPAMKAAATPLAARMDAANLPKPSASAAEPAAPGTPAGNAALIVAAAAKARGEKVPA